MQSEIKNLMNALRHASPETTKKGLNWYIEAHEFAKELSETFHVSFNNVCGIISALSPSCRWERNKLEARELIAALVYNLDASQISFTTYGQNVLKAYEIFFAEPDQVESFFVKSTSGFKTHNFFKNIQNPWDENYVTIDRHALFVYNGLKGEKAVGLTRKQYDKVANTYREFAKRIGVLPNQAQAILWETYLNYLN